MFDTLLKPAKSSNELCTEIERYLATDTEVVDDVLVWWWERRSMYPCLSRMGLDYLSIPGMFSDYSMCQIYYNNCSLATSVDVERVFSRGRLILSHVRSRLTAQSTRSLLCLGNWSLHGFIKDIDVETAAELPDVQEDDEEELEDGWDSILL